MNILYIGEEIGLLKISQHENIIKNLGINIYIQSHSYIKLFESHYPF